MFEFPSYDDISTWFKAGFWSEEMVKEGVRCQVITVDQFKEITGKEYVKD